MPKRVRAARHYQRDDDPVLRLSRSAMRGVARELKHAFNNLSSMVPVKGVAEAIRNGRNPAGLINWHHYREVLRGAFDRLGKLRHAGGALGARKINGVFAAKRRAVRFRKAGHTHFTSEGAVIGATKFAATRKASKTEAGYEDRSSHGVNCSECWMFQAVWQCCAVEGVINPNGWCTYWETVFAKAYNPDEPRDDHGRWTSGGESEPRQVPWGNFSQATGQMALNTLDAQATRMFSANSAIQDAPRFGAAETKLPDGSTLRAIATYRAANSRGAARGRGSSVSWNHNGAGITRAGALALLRTHIGKRFEKGYNPDEPRDERGRWTDGGGDDQPEGLEGKIGQTVSVGEQTVYRAAPAGLTGEQAFGGGAAGSFVFTSRRDAMEFARTGGGRVYTATLAAHEQGIVGDVDIELMGGRSLSRNDPRVFGNAGDTGLYPAQTQLYVRDTSLLSGFGRIGKSIEKATGDQFNFDSFSPAVQAAARAEQDRLIQQLEADARDTIDSVISAGLADGTSAEDMASEIADVIGLTETQWNAVDNYRNMLEELDPDSLARRLRNTEYDAVVQDSIDAQTDLSEAAIENMVSDYIENYIDYRAATIAQTESTRAANLGLHDAYDQAIERGALTDGAVTRFWQLGDNPCPVCESIVDNNPEGVGVDESFDSLEGPIDDPPVHPNCECSVDYVTDLNQVPDDGEEQDIGPGSFGVGGVDTPYMDDGGDE